MMYMYKTCTRCKKEKDKGLFGKGSRESDGLQDWCKQCFRDRYLEDRERKLLVCLAWKNKNKEKVREIQRLNYLASKDRRIKNNKIWAKANVLKTRAYKAKYTKANPERSLATMALRTRSNRSPISITYRQEMLLIYKLSKELSWLSESKLTVDHIIPVIHKDVCGLHVPWNLQVLPFDMNCKKSNSFDGTYDNESWRRR